MGKEKIQVYISRLINEVSCLLINSGANYSRYDLIDRVGFELSFRLEVAEMSGDLAEENKMHQVLQYFNNALMNKNLWK